MAEINYPSIVVWDENKSRAMAYRNNRQKRFAKLTLHEQEEKWRDAEKEDAIRLARLYFQLLRKNGRRNRTTKVNDYPEINKSYIPGNKNISYRLLLKGNLQETNCIIDPGTIIATNFHSSVDVYCDLIQESSDYFLSEDFSYRIGRPFRLGIEFNSETVPSTVNIREIPKELRTFAHSEKGLCRCSCENCRTNDKCECFLFAKVVNKGLASIKDGFVRFDREVKEVTSEDLESIIIGCGKACHCYQHKLCGRNIDLLHLDSPKLEIFRKDEKLNFCVRTLNSLAPGEFVTEFTGLLESENKRNPKEGEYAFQLVFDNLIEYLSNKILEGMNGLKTVSVEVFRTIYNDLSQFKEDNKQLGNVYIQPFAHGNVSMFISHGCLPNCFVVRVLANHVFPQFHRLFLVANQHIPAGSEIFINYGKAYFDSRLAGVCLCGTALCPNGEYKNFVNRFKSEEEVASYLSDKYLPEMRAATCRLDEEISLQIQKGILDVKTERPEDHPEIKPEDNRKAQINAAVRKKQNVYLKSLMKDIKKNARIPVETDTSDGEDYFTRLVLKQEPKERNVEVNIQNDRKINEKLIKVSTPSNDQLSSNEPSSLEMQIKKRKTRVAKRRLKRPASIRGTDTPKSIREEGDDKVNKKPNINKHKDDSIKNEREILKNLNIKTLETCSYKIPRKTACVAENIQILFEPSEIGNVSSSDYTNEKRNASSFRTTRPQKNDNYNRKYNRITKDNVLEKFPKNGKRQNIDNYYFGYAGEDTVTQEGIGWQRNDHIGVERHLYNDHSGITFPESPEILCFYDDWEHFHQSQDTNTRYEDSITTYHEPKLLAPESDSSLECSSVRKDYDEEKIEELLRSAREKQRLNDEARERYREEKKARRKERKKSKK